MGAFGNKLRELVLGGQINLLTDTIKVMLITSAYTPNADDLFVAAITGGTSKECSGTGYVAGFGGSGRLTVTSPSVVRDDATDTAYFDFDDPAWAGANFGTPYYLGIIKEVTDDAHSPLLGTLSITSPVPTNGGSYTVTIPANGALAI